jgi:hypothetical protein
MGLGDNAAALTLAERALALFPVGKDALTGPRPLEIFARITARIGDPDRSISTLTKLLSIPYEAPWPQTHRSLPRYSAWIQCLNHCATIHGSRNWLPLPRQNKVRDQFVKKALKFTWSRSIPLDDRP